MHINVGKNDFIKTMQKRTAVSSMGPSSLRNQGVGVLRCAQDYCGKLDLSAFSKSDELTFNKLLDRHTDRLLDILPVKTRPWGAARKAINLFLREALYNKYLSKNYHLNKIEKYLEIPLDRIVASELKSFARKELLHWPGLKKLKKPKSDEFQESATMLSDKNGYARVHLDMYLWLKNR